MLRFPTRIALHGVAFLALGGLWSCTPAPSSVGTAAHAADESKPPAATDERRAAQPAVAAPVENLRDGEDWPWFLGPRHDGTSAETGSLEPWPQSGLPLVWER